jgi:soluble epoxide hydrolase/lipid-phosphate phosphatase
MIGKLHRTLSIVSLLGTNTDRGCAIAYRFALEFPSFVTHLFTCAVPYLAASENYIPLETVVKFLPSLGYQLQFGSEQGIIESHTQDKAGIRKYLNALYGGRTSDGKVAMTPEKGVDLELMSTLTRSPLVSEDELNYYVEEYSRHGLRAPCKCFTVTITCSSTQH